MAAERFRLSLQYYPPIGWKFSNLKIRIDRAVPETFPAKIMGCGADGFPGAGGTLGDLVLKIREAPGQQPVLMVLANRDFYAHPCRLEATFPGGVSIAVGDVTGAPVAPPTVLDIGDAGRTGLAAGSLTVVLRRLANPRSPSEGEIHYTITLASAPAVDTASPRSYPATATGCSAAGAESETIFHGGLTGRSEARPDGSLRIELVARAAPGCRITASIPARSG
jgi:hypothetical protein